MIFYDTGNMMKIMCQMKGSVLLSVWPQMAITAGIAIFATLLRAKMGADEYIIQDVKGHATLGTALAFLNVFRSNLSYGRYWEGRGQLGVMVKSGRELIRKVVAYTRVPEDPKEDQEQLKAVKSVKRLVNCQFKSIILAIEYFETYSPIPPYDIEKELVNPGFLSETEKSAIEKAEPLNKDGLPDNKGRPILIAALLSHKVYYLYHRGWMNAAVLKKCDIEIDNFIGAWMACEKICGVPMVFPYTQMLTVFLVLFVYTFPLPLAHIFYNDEAEFNGFIITPFVSALVAFAFFGMNAVGIEIENPFGQDANDLPMKGMCKRVELDTAALLELRTAAVSDQMEMCINARAAATEKAKADAELLNMQAQSGSRRRRD